MGRLFDKLKAGLEDAIAFEQGDHTRGRVVPPPPQPDVRAIRERLGLTQDRFATRFGFTVATVRQWEQGRRKPSGPARVLLLVLQKHPDAVTDALAAK